MIEDTILMWLTLFYISIEYIPYVSLQTLFYEGFNDIMLTKSYYLKKKLQ